jgi:hypothetical protein
MQDEGKIYLTLQQDQINQARLELEAQDAAQHTKHFKERYTDREAGENLKTCFLRNLTLNDPRLKSIVDGVVTGNRKELNPILDSLLNLQVFKDHIAQAFKSDKPATTRGFLTVGYIKAVDEIASNEWLSIAQTFVDVPVESSASTDSLGILVENLRVPDVLFNEDAKKWHQSIGVREGEDAPKRIWILNAAHDKGPGGAFVAPNGKAMEENLYQQSDLMLENSGDYPAKGLQSLGGTYAMSNATAFEYNGENKSFTGETAPFGIVYAAAYDLRAGQADSSIRENFFPIDKGQSELFKLNFTNYFKTIAHVVQQDRADILEKKGAVKKPVCYLTALGCGEFANPNFLVAAAARLAIEKAKDDYGEILPEFKFAISGNSQLAQERRADFDRIINHTPLNEVKAMLNPNSALYLKEMHAFFFNSLDEGRQEQVKRDLVTFNTHQQDYSLMTSLDGCYFPIQQRILSIQSQLKDKFDRADKLNLIGRVASLFVIGGFVAIVLAKASVVLMGIALGTLALGTIGASALQMIYYGSNKAAFGAAGVSALLLGGSAAGLGYAIGLAKMTAFVTSLVSTILVTPVLAGFSALLGVVLLFGVIEFVKSLSKQCALFGYNALSLKDSLKHDQSVLACANDFLRAEENYTQDTLNSGHKPDGLICSDSEEDASRAAASSRALRCSTDAELSQGPQDSEAQLGGERSSGSVEASTKHDEPFSTSSQEPQAPSSSASPRV